MGDKTAPQKPAVLIVGAGPSGVILALTLAKNGVPIRVIEKDLHFHVGQRGPGLQPRSLEVFNFLGIVTDVLNNTIDPQPRRVYKMPEGIEPTATFSITGAVKPATPDIPFPNPKVIGQNHLEELIRAHLTELGVSVELGKELIEFEQGESGVVATVLTRGPEGECKETIEADYIVSAEGGRSIIRKQLGLSFLGETDDKQHFLITDIYLKGLDTIHWHAWGDMTDKAVWIRATEYPGLYNVMVVSASGAVDNEKLMASREALIECIHNITNRRELEFGEIVWQTLWRPNIRMVDRFSSGRAFLIGDAAHIHTPAGGQGLNTGMQDGFNLGWKLALVHKGFSGPSLLDSYNEERLPVAKSVLVLTTESFAKLQSFKAAQPDVTKVTLPEVLRQFGVNYRWSSIVVDEQEGTGSGEEMAAYLPAGEETLRAGDRAPDAPGLQSLNHVSQASTSLFAIFRPSYHTILLFDPTIEQVHEATSRLPTAARKAFRVVVVLSSDHSAGSFSDSDVSDIDHILLDTDGHAHTAYLPVKAGFPVIVVRPDSVIGAVVKGSAGIDKYLAVVFSGQRA